MRKLEFAGVILAGMLAITPAAFARGVGGGRFHGGDHYYGGHGYGGHGYVGGMMAGAEATTLITRAMTTDDGTPILTTKP